MELIKSKRRRRRKIVMKLKNREKYELLSPLIREDLLNVLKEARAIIAGGEIRAVFTDSKISDYDCYFRRLEDLEKVQKHLDNSNTGAQCVYTSENALTYRKNGVTIQLIKRFFYENPERLIGDFDFTVCMGAYDIAENRLVLDEDFLKHNSQRRLVYNIKAHYPIASLVRAIKYESKYGYKIHGSEMIKIGLAINRLKIETFADLKEQIMGVDTMLTRPILEALDNRMTAKYDLDEFMLVLDKCLDSIENV
jgi:hypothetical protein